MIKKEFGWEANVKKGPVGLFDVYVDEAVVYTNRLEGGRLPQDNEVVRRIRKHLAGSAQPPGGTGKKGSGKAGESQAPSGGSCGCG